MKICSSYFIYISCDGPFACLCAVGVPSHAHDIMGVRGLGLCTGGADGVV